MQIIDKYGYLESALDYIESSIISGKGLQKIAKKTRISEDLIKNLSLALKGFSEKQLLTFIEETLEGDHSSLGGADAEVISTDVGIEVKKNKAFVSLNILCDIVIDDQVEDKAKLYIKIFSKKEWQLQ